MSKFLSRFASGKYDVLPSTEEEKQSVTSEEDIPRVRSQSRWAVNFWLLTTILFASLSAWLGTELHARKFTGSFEKGFSTELGKSRSFFCTPSQWFSASRLYLTVYLESARHLIQVEQVTFKGSPHFHEDGSEYVPDDGQNSPQYVGEPSRAIDHAWALLHFGRFFLLTEDEARQSWGEGYKEFWSPKDGGYVAGYG